MWCCILRIHFGLQIIRNKNFEPKKNSKRKPKTEIVILWAKNNSNNEEVQRQEQQDYKQVQYNSTHTHFQYRKAIKGCRTCDTKWPIDRPKDCSLLSIRRHVYSPSAHTQSAKANGSAMLWLCALRSTAMPVALHVHIVIERTIKVTNGNYLRN